MFVALEEEGDVSIDCVVGRLLTVVVAGIEGTSFRIRQKWIIKDQCSKACITII